MGNKTLASLTRLPLNHLWRRIAEHERLQATLAGHLSPPLADHVQIARIDGQTLVLVTDSAAWAAELRFRSPELLQLINKTHRLALMNCRIAVSPPVPGRHTNPGA